jgi:hypothetical protein
LRSVRFGSAERFATLFISEHQSVAKRIDDDGLFLADFFGKDLF